MPNKYEILRIYFKYVFYRHGEKNAEKSDSTTTPRPPRPLPMVVGMKNTQVGWDKYAGSLLRLQ